MKKKALYGIASCAIVVAAMGYLSGQQPAGKSGGAKKGPDSNAADVTAVKKAGQSFLKAYGPAGRNVFSGRDDHLRTSASSSIRAAAHR